jgi:SAM-dependent methyltransferase
MKDYIYYLYNEVPKSCDPDDFSGQVKRTVNKKPVSEKDINTIVASIVEGLKLEKKDVLFDLGCGNGALSALTFRYIQKYHGVDFAEYLIEIAKKNFEKPGFTFECAEVNQYLSEIDVTAEYTKSLCYGVFSYFEREKALQILKNLHKKFPKIERFYIGNIADKERAENFFYKDIDYTKLIDNPQTNIGVWWSKDEFNKMGEGTGWNVDFLNMPKGFYSAHYRFDAILTRN